MTELKPCPFCGGKADPAGWMAGDGKTGPACDDCGSAGGSLEIWNTRTNHVTARTGETLTMTISVAKERDV